MKIFKPLLFLCSVTIIVSLACVFTGGADPTATPVVLVQPEQAQVEQVEEEDEPSPTLEPSHTQEPSKTPTEEPPLETEEPVEEPVAYYVEEFEGDLSGWSYFMMNGLDKPDMLYTEDGYLVFDLQDENQWVYVLYDEYDYYDVRVDVYAENRGKNTNNVSLICNYSDAEGWYEFNITNGGEYFILAYSAQDESYYTLAKGGSTHVVTGRSENIYTAICTGNQLALYINGFLEREYVDNRFNLQEGQVGVSVSSFDILPILVKIDYFAISMP